MKSIVTLTSLALVSLSNVAPCLATTQAISQSSDQSLSSKSSLSAAKTIQVAGIFNDLNRVVNTVKKVIDIGEDQKEAARKAQEKADREAAIAQEKADREAAQKKRQEELQAARKAATEKQRLEADRRQKYFESLSPAEKEAYLAQQRKQQEANKAAWLFVLGVLASGGGGSTAPQQDDPNAEYRRYLKEENDRRIQRENDEQHRRNIGW